MKILCIFFALLFSIKAIAISETNYKATYLSKVIPFAKEMDEGKLYSNGLQLSYRSFIQPQAQSCLVILPGRSEPAVKYAELVYDLVNNSDIGKKLNYFILDHRGQGSSERMVAPTDLGHVDHFSYYISDLDSFLKNVIATANCDKKFLFAHSMGAGIALRYIEAHPEVFTGLMISSPMLKIQTKPYPYWVAKTIIREQMIAGKGEQFSIGQKGYSSTDKFENNKFTTSQARFEMTMQLYEIFPETQLGGVSNRWLNEIMKGTIPLRKNYKKITAPMMLYRAGTELYSESEEMHRLCQTVNNCTEMLLPSSKHEVINDRDENRDQVIGSMILFMNRFL